MRKRPSIFDDVYGDRPLKEMKANKVRKKTRGLKNPRPLRTWDLGGVDRVDLGRGRVRVTYQGTATPKPDEKEENAKKIRKY